MQCNVAIPAKAIKHINGRAFSVNCFCKTTANKHEKLLSSSRTYCLLTEHCTETEALEISHIYDLITSVQLISVANKWFIYVFIFPL